MQDLPKIAYFVARIAKRMETSSKQRCTKELIKINESCVFESYVFSIESSNQFHQFLVNKRWQKNLQSEIVCQTFAKFKQFLTTAFLPKFV